MKRFALLVVLLLPACEALFGAPTQRTECATSAACPTGQYCARADGVCWPDAAPPTVGAVSVTCSTTPCLRDAVLTVQAGASDVEELGAVEASLDLDGGVRRVTLGSVGGGLFRGQLPLSQWAFPGVEAAVTASVRATDAAGNATTQAALGAQVVMVTRVRAGILLENGVIPSAPTVAANGTVHVGVGARLYSLAPGASTPVAGTAALVGAIQQPPVLGASAIWIAAGSRVFAVSQDGASVLNGAGFDTTAALSGPPAVSAVLSPEIAFVASGTGRLYAVKADALGDGFIDRTGAVDPFSSGPVLDGDTTAFAVSGKASPATATLRQYLYDGALTPGWSRDVGSILTAPLSVDGAGGPWSTSTDVGKAVDQTLSSGAAGTTIPLTSSAGGGVAIMAGGDVAFCEGSTLRRFSAAGVARWTSAPTLGGVGLTPMILAGGPAAFLVPTRSGTVHAIDAGGHELWSATLASGTELKEGNLFRAPGAATSTAWFTSADGKLHGVVVDGWLDPAAPWPKAWHDPRNTSNTGTPF